MSMTCKFCHSEHRLELETELAARKITLEDASKLIGCSIKAVQRHLKTCVPDKIAAASNALAITEGSVIIDTLTHEHNLTRQIIDRNFAAGEDKIALQALLVSTRQIDLAARLSGQFAQAASILGSPEFLILQQVLYQALEPYPQLKLEVSEALDKKANEYRDAN
jgi:hypothetical protein